MPLFGKKKSQQQQGPPQGGPPQPGMLDRRIVDNCLGFIASPDFGNPVVAFLDKFCHIFSLKVKLNLPQQQSLHVKYRQEIVKLVDVCLTQRAGITLEQWQEAAQLVDRAFEGNAFIIAQIKAYFDFFIFRKLMRAHHERLERDRGVVEEEPLPEEEEDSPRQIQRDPSEGMQPMRQASPEAMRQESPPPRRASPPATRQPVRDPSTTELPPLGGPPKKKPSKADWFCETVGSRAQAEEVMREFGQDSFLIRNSSEKGCYVLSLYTPTNNIFQHLQIKPLKNGGWLLRDPRSPQEYDSLEELVELLGQHEVYSKFKLITDQSLA